MVFVVLGPLSFLIIGCFEKKVAIENMAFIPTNPKENPACQSFIIQASLFAISVGIMTLYIIEWRSTDDIEDDVRPMSVIPLVAACVPYLIRQIIISVRYGTTPVSEYRK